MKKVLICDDHAMVREALSGTIRMGWPEAEVKEAADFPTAWAAARNDIDICIADLMMPGASPLAGIDGLIRVAPRMKILIVTGTEDDALLLDLLDRGVAGFSSKSANGSVIEAVLRLIEAGGRYLPPRLANIAAAQVDMQIASLLPPSGPKPIIRLSTRQRDVLKLVSEGYSNKEIAKKLDLAPSTVKTHVSSVLVALGASNRTDAVSKARFL